MIRFFFVLFYFFFISSILCSQNRRGDSLESLWKTYSLEVPNRMDSGSVRILNELSAEFLSNNPSKALEYATRSRAIAETIGDKTGYAHALRYIGIIYFQKGVYDKALEHFFSALKLYEELNAQNFIARTLSNVATTYDEQGNIKASEEYYLKSIQLYRALHDSKGVAEVFNNLGLMYLFGKENPTKALECFFQSISLHDEHGDNHLLAVSFINVGTLYHEQGRYDSANYYFLKAIPACEYENDKQNLGTLYINLGSVNRKLKKYSEAIVYINKALHIADTLQSRTLQKDGYINLSVIYEELHKPTLALSYFRRFDELKDSIFQEDITKRTTEMQAKYEAEKKDLQILTLQKEKERESLERSQFQRNLIIGFILLGIILILVANGYRIKRKSESILQGKNLELEAANTEILRQNHHLEELNTEKNEFMGIVAHDLKNPILSIKLLAQLLHDHDAISWNERMKFAGTIISSSDQMSRIINNLLDVNAIEQGGIKLDITSFDISVAAYTVFEEYEPVAESKGIQLHFLSHTDTECLADQTATMQILDNLVSNALKYSPAGKNVWLRVYGEQVWTANVGHSTPQSNGHYASPYCVRLEITDEGPGISDSDQKKLFGKFVRLSAQPTNGERSTGLGLSIVKKMALVMNGQVWCTSDLGKGATFFVELPQYSNSDD